MQTNAFSISVVYNNLLSHKLKKYGVYIPMNKVAILMSTYNGQKYLKEQIESILAQTYSNWTLYIRDDGSSDETINIIESYSTNSDQVIFFNKDNITNMGVKNSFFSLLKDVNADYYMFCDQDDVWQKQKVQHAIEAADNNTRSSEEPLLIHTELTVVDSNLTPLGLMYGDDFHDGFKDNLFSNSVTGCTMLLNQALKNRILDFSYEPTKIVMHDWWFALIASAFGKVVFLKNPDILYRQHGNNTFGANVTPFQRLQRLLKMENEIKRFSEAYVQDDYFLTVAKDEVTTDQMRLLNGVSKIYRGTSGWNALRQLKKYQIRKTTTKGTFMLWYVSIFKFKKLKEMWNK